MAKTKISEFSSTPGNNTDIDGINIAEGCAPSGINNAIRELMSQLKDFQAGTAGDSFNGPVGTTTAAAGAFTTLTTSSTVTHNAGTANGVAYLNGSKVLTTGSALTFDGTNLGVGQATPTVKLQVDTASASGDLVGWFRQSTFPVAGIRSGSGYAGFGQSAASSETRIYADGATSFITNYLGGSEQMRLTSTGLGIGTSSLINGGRLSVRDTTGNPQLSIGDAGSYVSFYTSGGALYLQPAGTTRAILDSSGNLGLGVTPSAWATYKAFSVGNSGNSVAGTGTEIHLTANCYFNSGWKYNSTERAARFSVGENYNDFKWYTAPSGTAGNAISFTQAMTLDASGNLVVGGTSANGKLDVYGILAVSNSAGNYWAFDRDDSNGGLKISDGTTERARITSGGNFGIGTTSPGQKLEVSNNGSVSIRLFDQTTNFWDITNNSNLIFSRGGIEHARIDLDGNVLVGTTSPEAKLTVSESANAAQAAYIDNTNASFTQRVISVNATRNTSNGTYTFISCSVSQVAERFRVLDSGNVQNTNNSYGSLSDVKLKENIVDATPKLEKLNQVRVVNYNLIGSEQKQLGVIAQELEQIFPGMVEESHDRDAEGNDLGTTTKAVKYSVFVPMLIKAIQEQQAIINQLKARLDAANL